MLIATRVQPLKVFYVMVEALYLDIMDECGVSVILFLLLLLLFARYVRIVHLGSMDLAGRLRECSPTR